MDNKHLSLPLEVHGMAVFLSKVLAAHAQAPLIPSNRLIMCADYKDGHLIKKISDTQHDRSYYHLELGLNTVICKCTKQWFNDD